MPSRRPLGYWRRHGTWEQVEDLNRWILVFPVVEISGGSRVRSEGVLDLETRMLKDKMYDAS